MAPEAANGRRRSHGICGAAIQRYRHLVTPIQGSDEVGPQPTWTVYTTEDEDQDDEQARSRFVEVTVTHRLEVTDDAALRLAVAASAGAPHDDLDRRLRSIPANLVGLALTGPLALPDMTGVKHRGSAMSVAAYLLPDA